MPAARARHRRQLLVLRQRPSDHRAATRTRRPARAAGAGLAARPRLATSARTAMPRRSQIAASCDAWTRFLGRAGCSVMQDATRNRFSTHLRACCSCRCPARGPVRQGVSDARQWPPGPAWNAQQRVRPAHDRYTAPASAPVSCRPRASGNSPFRLTWGHSRVRSWAGTNRMRSTVGMVSRSREARRWVSASRSM
jgi:hypothetical protein